MARRITKTDKQRRQSALRSYKKYHQSEKGQASYRARILRNRFGLSSEAYEAILSGQDYKCAICGNKESAVMYGKTIHLSVDHCHKTGKIRGLLCLKCNTAIGKLDDDPKLLRKAARYLERSENGNS
jgi:hypothetical protein